MIDLNSFPRSGQFVVSKYESKGGKKLRKKGKNRTNKERMNVRKIRRTKKLFCRHIS